MTTTASALAAPDVLGLASRFDVAASTPQFGLEALFGRWSDLRIASARHNPDLLAAVSFASILDAVLDYRSNPAGATFNVLTIAKAIQL